LVDCLLVSTCKFNEVIANDFFIGIWEKISSHPEFITDIQYQQIRSLGILRTTVYNPADFTG